MKDYSYLEGTTVNAKGDRYFDKLLIAGIDPDIGITLVDAEDRKTYFYCLLGPTAFRTKYGTGAPYPDTAKNLFPFVAGMLERGVFDMSEFMKLHRGPNRIEFDHDPSAKFCGFNQ
jgi:hypothetical protein